MKKRWLGTITAFAAAALVAGAVPALAANTGTINLTVTAAAPAGPCVESPAPPGTQVAFGFRPFSTAAPGHVHSGRRLRPPSSNCSPTAARSSSTSRERTPCTASPPVGIINWTLAGGVRRSVPGAGPSGELFYNTDNVGSWPITRTNALLQNLSNGATTFAPGEAHNLGLEIGMPCQGTAGAGLSQPMSVPSWPRSPDPEDGRCHSIHKVPAGPRARFSAAAVAVLAAFVLPGASSADRGVALDLGKLEIEQTLTPGGGSRLPLVGVRNPGDEVTTYRMIVSSVPGQAGIPVPGDWFDFEPNELTLKPGDTKKVDARLSLPTRSQSG